MTLRTWSILMLVLGSAAACAHAQNTVTLHGVARLGPDQPLVLSAIATLDGPLTAGLGDTPIDLPPATGRDWHRIEAQEVRTALAQTLGERGAMVIIRGGPCDLRRLTPARPSVEAEAAAKVEPTPDASGLVDEPTVQGHIARRIASLLDADPADLRLSFEARDEALLETLSIGRVVDARPIGSGARIPFVVKVFEGDRLIAHGTTRVGVERRATVAVVARPVGRDHVFTADDITPDRQWLSPDIAFVSPAAVIGRVAKGPMQPGLLIDEARIAHQTVVRRGDIVNVDVVAGSVVMTAEYRARTDAGVGDIIEFEAKDDRSRTLRARVQGRGRAVTVTGQAPAPTAAPEEASR